MRDTNTLFSEVVSLPLEIRVALVNKLPESLNPIQSEINNAWAIEAEKRVSEIESGQVQTISGEEVFKEIKEKYNL